MPIRGLPNGAAALVHAIHTPDAVLRNRWTPPSGMGGGRHVPESVVVMNRCAHCDARLERFVLLQEFVDPGQERIVLLDEFVDPRHQREHQPLQAFGVERINPLGRHPELESDHPDALNASRLSHSDAGGE